MDLGLTGKVALVTGSRRGIGHGVAITLGRERAGKSEAEVRELHVREIDLTRFSAPDDTAGLVAFRVSPRGRRFHGTTIDMDRGAGRAP
jgi:NAD(P)-dependent dehydrogenase (short-subunit alcohol dehydrogenase family)